MADAAWRSLPATPGLPSLDLSTEPGELLQGLLKLRNSARRFSATCHSARPLRSISYLGHVANSRLKEAATEMNSHESQVYASLTTPPFAPERNRGPGGLGVAEDRGVAEQGLRIKPVKQDEVVLESFKVQEVKHYKVILPSRPMVVTITVTRTSGASSPQLFGSTVTKRPTSMDNEFKGKEDKLIYQHAILPSTDADGEDRAEPPLVLPRATVPNCRELYFTLDAYRTECTLKFQVTFSNLKLKLSDDVFSPKVARSRHGWEARLAEVTRTARTREDFEEKLKVMEAARRQKIEDFARGRNFLELNQARLSAENWSQRHMKIQRKAVIASQRQTEAMRRREEYEEATQERHVLWMSRAENKRREREEQELHRSLELQQEGRQQSWFAKIFTVTFQKTTAEIFQERKRELEQLRKQLASATVLDSSFRRALVRKRRNMIWRNAIKLKVAVTVYARTVLPMVKALASPLIKEFISLNAFNKEAPSIHTVFSHYRAGVMRIQRFWLRIRMMRKAFVRVLMPVWSKCETEVYEIYEKDQEAARAAAAKAQDEKFAALEGLLMEEKRPSKSKDKGATDKSKLESRFDSKDSSKKRIRTMPSLTRASVSQTTPGVDEFDEPLPLYVADLALYHQIALMQRTFPVRLSRWGESMQQAQDNADVEKFVKSTEGESSSMKQLRLSRPRKIYVDEDEIMALVRRTVDSWHLGGFVHVKANRLRLLRFGFRALYGEHRMKTQSQGLANVRQHRMKKDRASRTKVSMNTPVEGAEEQ